MQTLKKTFIILSMAALLALGTAALLPSPALAACTPTPTNFDDFIVCDGSVGVLDARSGDDIINNYGAIYYLYGNAGNDIITNYGVVTAQVHSSTGNDIIINYGTINNISSGPGNDIITNYGSAGYIYGSSGNDIITNYGVVTVFIDAGTGNDLVTNNGIVTGFIQAGPGDDTVVLGKTFVMSGLVDGASDFDTLKFDTVGDTRADVRALLLALAENKSAGTLTWRGETFSWINFEALTGSARYRSAVVSDGLIRVTETLDSLLIIGLDKGKINLAVPVNFTRLKHVTDGQTIADFTDNDGYNLQLHVLSADDNLWTVYYYAPDGTLISSYSFEFDPIW